MLLPRGWTSPLQGATTFTPKEPRSALRSLRSDARFDRSHCQLAELNLPRNLESLTKIPPFAPTGGSLAQVHKTGLGSSAALITSLVSALLVHFSVIPSADLSEDSEGRHLAHNLAQYVHCLAQGKVGSGFDVAAAVFGSHLYTRFDPSVLEDLMTGDTVSILSPRRFAVHPLTRLTDITTHSFPNSIAEE